MSKTDNPEQIGQHIFEAAGLGTAPFAWVGYAYVTFQATPDSPVQCGGSCDYCGQGIVNHCYVKSSDGKRFKVGPDCIERVGDRGLMRAYKASPERRKAAREMRHVREKAKLAERTARLDAAEAELKSTPHSRDWAAAKGMTAWDEYRWWGQNGGTSGKLRGFAALLKRLEEAEVT